MAEDPDAPLLNLTVEEKRLFSHLFRLADSESIGVVTGEAAVKFFEKTRIEPRILGEIWQIADKENRGLLTPAGFGIVLRLIGHYQAGRNPTPDLVLRPGPPPRFESIDTFSLSSTNKQPLAPIPRALESQVSGSTTIRVPPLTPDKVAQYVDLFENSGGLEGILSGERAKKVFERAGLPNEVLGRIWNLADTEQKGALEATEFVIAMHLIASLKKGQMRLLPNTLPPGLFEAASRRTTDRAVSSTPTISSVPRQLSGSSSTRSTYIKAPQLLSQTTGSNGIWLITPSDQMKFDSIFKTLDKANQGFITGDQAVPFFSESKLPEHTLAQIWDLADINSAGRLSREEFAVAMYLIRLQRGKRDGRQSLPSKLPANLVPPSMRNQTRSSTDVVDTSFDTPTPVLPRSAAEDLFGLDALSSSTINESSIQNLEATALSATTREITTASHTTNLPTAIPSTSSTAVKPFKPASSFGQTLSQQITGDPKTNVSFLPQSLRPQNSLEDLLGDTDAEISKKLTDETTELANLSNQASSLSKQTQDLQAQKVFLQNESTQSSTKKIELEARVAQARKLYEQEIKEVRNFQEQLVITRNETNKLRIEAEKLEEALQNNRNEHNVIVKALYIDQQENSNLKERISQLNSEIIQLKTVLESVKLDARQQRGLVSINQKQLITNEEERDRIKTQIEEFNIDKKEDSVGPISSKVQPSSLSTNPSSTTNSMTNPFFRRIESFSENPFSKVDTSSAGSQQSEKLLKSVFGPSFESSTSNEAHMSNSELERTKSYSISSSNTTTFIPIQSTGDNSSKTPSSFPEYSTVSQELPKAIASSVPLVETQTLNSSTLFSSDRNPPTQAPINTSNSEESLSGLSISTLKIGKITESREAQKLFTSDDNMTSENSITDQFNFKSLESTRTVKDDFDSAFASFGTTAKAQDYSNTCSSDGQEPVGVANSVGLANEFPPIAEIGDDESDSSSEGIGFDDDFATVSSTFDKNISDKSIIPTQPSEKENLSLYTSTNCENTTIQAQKSSITDNCFTSEGNPAQSTSIQFSSDSRSTDQFTTLSTSQVETTRTKSLTNELDIKTSIKSLSSSPRIPLDDEFDDLEDAEEGDSNDEFAKISGADQSLVNDIDSSFDKSLPVRETEIPPNYSTGDPSQLGNTRVQDTSVLSDKHDWDSIFSSLDASEPCQIERITGLANTDNTSAIITEGSQAEAKTSENDLQDDPFLKKLTGMGYQRTDALVALERFDYNLEKAANFLASKS